MSNKIATYQTVSDIKTLIEAFEAATLPRGDWNHQAHLTVALWYLTHYSESEATNRICDRIQRYNTTMGIKTTKDGGYHETLTRFGIQMVCQYLWHAPANESIVDIANSIIQIYADKDLPLEY